MGVGMGGRSFRFSVFSYRLSAHSLPPERLIPKSEGQERFLAPRTPLGMTRLGVERCFLVGLKTGHYMSATALASSGFLFVVAAVSWGNGVAVRTGFRVAEEGA